MKFGLIAANTVPFTDPGLARDLAQAAEEVGFESLWTVEHVIWPTEYDSHYPYHRTGKMPGTSSIPIPDPLIWLTWVAAATNTIRLGTGVMILPLRNPLVVAKELATLDQLSGGRVELGIGVGWLEEEFEALGMDFSQRGRRTDEMLDAFGQLWSNDPSDYQGDLISFSNVALNPKPISGAIPVTVGGQSRHAARRAAVRGNGFYPGPGDLDGLRQAIDLLHEECSRVDRDPSEVKISASFPGRFLQDPAHAIDQMTALGVDRIMIPIYDVSRPDLATGMENIAAAIR